MLNRLADLRGACPRQEVCFLLATNYIDKIEPALIRKGRIDRAIAVVYPDWESRTAMIPKGLRRWQKRIVKETAGWPWMAIRTACDETLRGKNLSPARPVSEILDQVLEEIPTPPQYKSRLEGRADSEVAPELLDEYLRHLISQAKNLTQLQELAEQRCWVPSAAKTGRTSSSA